MRGAALAAAVVCLLAAAPARATEPEPAWRLALYRTLTFETAANVADVALFALFFGGGPATAAGFFAVNTASAAVATFAHELAWEHWGPPVDDANAGDVAARKTLTHRTVSIVRNLGLGGLFGGGLGQTLGFTITGQVMDAGLYYVNERLWRIHGPPIAR